MIKRILSFLAVFAMTSCAAVYYQVATIGSSQMSVLNDGKFRYNENDLTVDYDFWSKYGKVGFVITNNTNDDIYINLSRSFFVVNGMTFDYFQNRTYKSERSNTYVSSDPAVIEIKEKEGVWIPAYSSRYFCEFSLLKAPYRTCGLPRDPSRKETASVDFTESNTPYAFENRIMIEANGHERHLVNSFFIQNITNLPESEAVEEYTERDCSGNKTGEIIKIYKYRANNRFFINYEFGGRATLGSSNDRLKKNASRTPFGRPSTTTESRFNDGLYGD